MMVTWSRRGEDDLIRFWRSPARRFLGVRKVRSLLTDGCSGMGVKEKKVWGMTDWRSLRVNLRVQRWLDLRLRFEVAGPIWEMLPIF